MGTDDFDSSGKNKPNDARSRSSLLIISLLVGVCIGIVFSERVYVHYQETVDGGKALAVLNKRTAGGSTSRILGQLSLHKPTSPLEELLMRIAPQKEVMIGISNFNLIKTGQLVSFLETVAMVKIPNFLIVAIDTELRDYLTEKGVNVYYKDIQITKSQKDTGENHAISALKFVIIKEFLELGWNVLLSDIDIVVVQNPFDHLYRDHDVEGMTDGYDKPTAYGHIDGIDDPSMGWARYAQATRHLNLNSGLFYLQSNTRTIGLMNRIAARLSKEKAWDQSVFNEEIFFLSHDDYLSPNISVRVMNIFKFMNSKVLFKQVRHMARARQQKPVTVHINYHPDKNERQRAVMKYFIDGDDHALDAFPGGSEPGS